MQSIKNFVNKSNELQKPIVGSPALGKDWSVATNVPLGFSLGGKEGNQIKAEAPYTSVAVHASELFALAAEEDEPFLPYCAISRWWSETRWDGSSASFGIIGDYTVWSRPWRGADAQGRNTFEKRMRDLTRYANKSQVGGDVVLVHRKLAHPSMYVAYGPTQMLSLSGWLNAMALANKDVAPHPSVLCVPRVWAGLVLARMREYAKKGATLGELMAYRQVFGTHKPTAKNEKAIGKTMADVKKRYVSEYLPKTQAAFKGILSPSEFPAFNTKLSDLIRHPSRPVKVAIPATFLWPGESVYEVDLTKVPALTAGSKGAKAPDGQDVADDIPPSEAPVGSGPSGTTSNEPPSSSLDTLAMSMYLLRRQEGLSDLVVAMNA